MTHSTTRGALWMVLFKLLERGLGLISTIILARLLLPKDFGIVAMALSIVALLEIFSAFGMDTVLIQRQDASTDHFNTAWTLNVLAGCAVGAVVSLLALPASRFYHEPRLLAVMGVLAVSAVVGGCENIGVVLFRKQLRFDREFRYLITKKLLAFAVTVPLAFWLRSYWALVLGTFIGRAGAVGYSYFIQPFRPRFSLRAASDMLHFSKWLMIQDALFFLRERSASFFIGRLAGPAALGSFTLAAEIANMPGTELIAPINRALLPAYSRLASDPPALRAEFLASMAGIALLGIPAVAGVALAAPFIVLVALGPKWSAAQSLLEVLAFYGVSQVLLSNSYAALIAIGKPGLFTRVGALYVSLQLAGLIALTPSWGALGAAWAYVIAAIGSLPLNFLYVTRQLGVRFGDLLKAVWRPLASTAVMYGCGRLWAPQLPADATSLDALVPLGICVAVGAVTYTATDVALWAIAGRPIGAETWVLRRLRRFALT
ncbi:MAG TPA: lipopolysaccharide biosynthesis protein [Steroidobacteraceae bacterium]|nr:lipopolysaccharide biosynthesis protein [Steroidobacteraceae bacterium]